MMIAMLRATLAATVLLGVSSASQAAATWNFGGNACTQNGANANNWGNSYACSATSGSGPGLTAYAWGRTNTASQGYQTASLKRYDGGFGVASRTEGLDASSPEHSADNNPNGGYVPDLILLKFDTAIALDKISLGWSQNDADITVMAYTGGALPSSFLQGLNANANLSSAANVAAGWSLVQHSGSAGTTGITGQRTVNETEVVSSWWLISAYNAGFSGSTAIDGLTDYVKLLAVASKDVQSGGSVAEPGTLAMAGIALLGLMGVRRRTGQTR